MENFKYPIPELIEISKYVEKFNQINKFIIYTPPSFTSDTPGVDLLVTRSKKKKKKIFYDLEFYPRIFTKFNNIVIFENYDFDRSLTYKIRDKDQPVKLGYISGIFSILFFTFPDDLENYTLHVEKAKSSSSIKFQYDYGKLWISNTRINRDI